MRKQKLSVLALVMINVIAVDNLRGIPFSAKLGLSLISYYALAALVFFIPTALVTAELATAWPNKGGIYVWVKEAFGDFYGFMTIWLQWIYNVVWYPTILTFVAANLATLIDPALAHNNLYTWLVITLLFWSCTIVNYYGLELSSLVSTIGATIGTLLPMAIITYLGISWVYHGHSSAMPLSWSDLVIQLDNTSHLSTFCFIIFGLIGIEMSAVHADEVDHPKQAYPRAIWYSSWIIFLSLIVSTLAVGLVVNADNLSVTTGLVQAFSVFFAQYGLLPMLPYLTLCIIIGSLSSVVTWIIGPTKGLLIASYDQCLPAWFGKTNDAGIPTNILLLQAIVFSTLSFAYIFIPNVDAVYEILSILTTQLALLVYILLFASAITLRKRRQLDQEGFTIPGGKWGLYMTTFMGISACCIVLVIGFIPPPEVHYTPFSYVATMITALMICIGPALIFYRRTKRQHQDPE
jgi:amino acid transporter